MQKQRQNDFAMMINFIKSGHVNKKQFEGNTQLFENIAQAIKV